MHCKSFTGIHRQHLPNLSYSQKLGKRLNCNYTDLKSNRTLSSNHTPRSLRTSVTALTKASPTIISSTQTLDSPQHSLWSKYFKVSLCVIYLKFTPITIRTSEMRLCIALMGSNSEITFSGLKDKYTVVCHKHRCGHGKDEMTGYQITCWHKEQIKLELDKTPAEVHILDQNYTIVILWRKNM